MAELGGERGRWSWPPGLGAARNGSRSPQCIEMQERVLTNLARRRLMEHALKIETAALSTIAAGKNLTGDLGGKGNTSSFTKEILGRL